ncbi:MAG TPA: hypothetical protein VN366_13870 [Feifaniaceae bacterium]|nr:hypothetical protein [Feifaniaceae bacterium]
MQPPGAQRTYLLNQVEFAFQLRRLLQENAQWTREVMLLSAAEGGDAEAALQRLGRNVQEMSGLVRQMYGERTAAQFDGILNVQNNLVVEMIDAIKANDTQRLNELNIQAYAVADNAADFISGLNSSFDRNEFRVIFYDLAYMIENEAMQILSGRYAESIAQYDRIVDRMMTMADDIIFTVIRQV